MASKALTTAKDNSTTQRGMLSINVNKVNYGAAKDIAAKYSKSVGGGEGGNKDKQFPGDQIGFKAGVWARGWGKTAKAIKKPKLVVNIPNMMAGYSWWEEVTKKDGDVVNIPKYTPMTFPATGQDPIERESLGQTEEKHWEKDDDGKPQDPFKSVLVFPVRDENGDTVDHVLLVSKSHVIAGFNFFRDVSEEMMLHPGQLPIVVLGTDTATMKNPDKKSRTKQFSWQVPTFEVIGWTNAKDCDNPSSEGGVEVTSNGDEADIGKVTAKTRAATKPAKLTAAERKVLEGKDKSGSKKRRQIEADDEAL